MFPAFAVAIPEVSLPLMIGSQRNGVFLSYARSDGEDFAKTLRNRLSRNAPDIVIKQDRLLLEGGVGWWKQLTDAIDSVEFLVLIMTPSAMQSAMVQKEWRYARQQGVCVYPVKAVPDSQLQFSQLPRWMSKAHFFDIEKEWETFLVHLRRGCDTRRVPFMPPDLSETFIQRPDEFGRLKNLLLSTDCNQPVAITTALSGAGGFGKTTLAAALCHDEDIIQNFDDGILWVTLGQNPNVLGSLVTVYAALTGERPGFASEDDAVFQLGQKLEDRTCLLVIDDVWDESHLRPFLRGGKGCGRLFTTRNAEIASNAQPVNVDEMRESESLALLTRGVPGLDAARGLELSRKLGEWPIALELACAMMRQRMDQGDSALRAADRLLQILNRKGPRGLAKGTGDPQHRTIDGVLEGSLELISANNPSDRQRLTELSIFPEDVAIPLSAAAALWQLDEFEAEETAQRFARLYLVETRSRARCHALARRHAKLAGGRYQQRHGTPQPVSSRVAGLDATAGHVRLALADLAPRQSRPHCRPREHTLESGMASSKAGRHGCERAYQRLRSPEASEGSSPHTSADTRGHPALVAHTRQRPAPIHIRNWSAAFCRTTGNPLFGSSPSD